jgi:arylsulfatase A-like enzyme
MADQPNILFIITDQHRADYLGNYGHKVVQSQNIDSLAARGRAFDRFYVANPVCQPNRATLMTGRMPSVHGVRHNGINLSVQSVTFLDLMRQAGYRTALLGKSHLQNMTDGPPRISFPDAKDGQTPPPADLREAKLADAPQEIYEAEHPKNWGPHSEYQVKTPFYGFDEVALTTGHGDRVGGDYDRWLEERHPGADKLRGPENALPHDYTCPQAWRTAIPEELFSTAYVAEKTIGYIENHAQNHSDQPFFAMASIADPHHPFCPPGKYWDMFDPDDMELPPSFYSNEPKPPSVAWQHKRREEGTQVTQGQELFALNERQAKEAVALTCGSIKYIDDYVGKILAKLDELGLAENTIVIFTADHGDLMAEHQLMLKGPIHYQGLIRVPFIWADLPGVAEAGRSDAMCGTLDIAQTILDRVGLQGFNGMQGRSLLPEIGGAADQGNGSVVVEADDQRAYFDVEPPARCRTLVTRTHRMTIYNGVEWGEMYDLENDPNEIHNLFDDPAHAATRAELFELLTYRQMDFVDRSPLPSLQA